MRDWSLSFFTALAGYGIDCAASFSMELGNGDPSAAAGIAQVGPAGDPILLPTPSLQTNFSPASLAFWQEVYLEMAGIQAAAGLQPYLQFGEVQWWYFPNDGDGHPFSGMPFYDAWDQAQFLAEFGRAMTVFTTNTVNPASYPDEVAYLQATLGNFTNAIMTFVRATYSTCRFEVLYPTDVNQTAFNQAINYPPSCVDSRGADVPEDRELRIHAGAQSRPERSRPSTSELRWDSPPRSAVTWSASAIRPPRGSKKLRSALGKGFESVVLFALDQFCLIGYATPLPESLRRSVRMGS